MGTEYTLINHSNKTMFELGKGPWYDVIDQTLNGSVNLLYRDTFVAHSQNCWRDHWFGYLDSSFSNGKEADIVGWVTDAANTIFDFIDGVDPEKDLSICRDTTDEIDELLANGYIYLGSRYKYGQGYNEYISAINATANTSIDLSNIDFKSISIARLRKLLIFC